MRVIISGFFISTCVVLSGCGSTIAALNKSRSDLVGAAPLVIKSAELEKAENCVDSAGSTCRKDFITSVALQSVMSCQEFANQLVLTENTVNTTGDIATTILTALGTVFTPLTTVHALTAGATVVGGSKSAINANVYAKASISSLQSGLDKVYTQPMFNYLNDLKKEADDSKISVGDEILNVQLLHGNCTLAEAEVFINGTVNKAPAATPPFIEGVVPASAVPHAAAPGPASGG